MRFIVETTKLYWRMLLLQPVAVWIRYPTLLTLTFYFGFHHPFDLWLGVLTAAAILFPGLANRCSFWTLVVALCSYDLYHSWITAANHTWVMWYWVIAIWVSTCWRATTIRTEILTKNARWLLVIIMLVAVIWKVINPYYMDGSFFERNLVANSLMTTFTHTFTGLSWEAITYNQTIQSYVLAKPVETTLRYHSNTAAHILAIVTTWWVLLIELLIGGLLLIRKSWSDIWAHILHMWFITVVYFAVPILGFAFILTVLGSTLTSPQQYRLRVAYICLYILLCFYTLPWDHYLFMTLGLYPLW